MLLLHIHLTSHASYSCLSYFLLCLIPSNHWCHSPYLLFFLFNCLLGFCFVLLHSGTFLLEPRACTVPSKRANPETRHNIASTCDHCFGSPSPILRIALRQPYFRFTQPNTRKRWTGGRSQFPVIETRLSLLAHIKIHFIFLVFIPVASQTYCTSLVGTIHTLPSSLQLRDVCC